MRVTGGRWASRRLAGPPKGVAIRPTPDALREQAFAVLGGRLEGAAFLDLFCGTGAVSIEALSRGAASVVLVEQARVAAELALRNLRTLDVPPERFELIRDDAGRAVDRLAKEGRSFPIAWCDPPFSSWEAGAAVLTRGREAGLLPSGALVVLETPSSRVFPPRGFARVRGLRGAFLLVVEK